MPLGGFELLKESRRKQKLWSYTKRVTAVSDELL